MTVENSENKTNGWGGARDGGGRPKGSKNKATIENEIINDEIRQRVLRGKETLINAQFNLARGASYLYKIVTTKQGVKQRPELIEDLKVIEDYLNGDLDGTIENDYGQTEYYYITTEKPDNKAIDSLIDRTVGKSVNRHEVGDPNAFTPQPIIDLSESKPDAIHTNDSDQENKEIKKED